MELSTRGLLDAARRRSAELYSSITGRLPFAMGMEVRRDGARFELDLREHCHCLMLLNLAENSFRRRMVRLLPPGGVVVDVGAHVGFWTIPAARRLGPQGRVLAVEPNPWAVDGLRRNLSLNQRCCHLSPVSVVAGAAGAQDGAGELLAHDFVANASQASLHPPTVNGTFLCRLTVPVYRLDSLIEGHIDLLKIDVEGHEMAVLDGAAKLFGASPPTYLVVEIHGRNLARAGQTPANVLTRLSELGYREIDSDRVFSSAAQRRPPALVFETVACKYEGDSRRVLGTGLGSFKGGRVHEDAAGLAPEIETGTSASHLCEARNSGGVH